MDESGKEVSAADIWNIFDRAYLQMQAPYGYVAHHLVEDSSRNQVELSTEISIDGRRSKLQGKGNGPIDAFVAGLAQLIGEPIGIVDYAEHAIGAGADAAAVTYIELKIGEPLSGQKTVFGVGRDANIVTASLKAILSGVNRVLSQRAKIKAVA
jgi:2-isopropylmalate synthase